MTDLDQILSSLLTSLARARQTADFESAMIAEQYRKNPLLEGLGAPRIRVGEVELEFPMMIEAVIEGTPNRLADSASITTRLMPMIEEVATKAGHTLAPAVLRELEERLAADLAEVCEASGSVGDKLVPREAVSRRAQESVRQGLLESTRIDPVPLRAILNAVARETFEAAEVEAGRPAEVAVNVLSSEVKEKSSPSTVARLRIVLKEEGLEWTSDDSGGGGTRQRLVAE